MVSGVLNELTAQLLDAMLRGVPAVAQVLSLHFVKVMLTFGSTLAISVLGMYCPT